MPTRCPPPAPIPISSWSRSTAARRSKITINPGADSSPHYSPDGKYIAYRAQFRAGYESDRWRLLVLERATGKVTNLTENLDRWVNGFTWSPDSTQAVLHRRRIAAASPSSSSP